MSLIITASTYAYEHNTNEQHRSAPSGFGFRVWFWDRDRLQNWDPHSFYRGNLLLLICRRACADRLKIAKWQPQERQQPRCDILCNCTGKILSSIPIYQKLTTFLYDIWKKQLNKFFKNKFFKALTTDLHKDKFNFINWRPKNIST